MIKKFINKIKTNKVILASIMSVAYLAAMIIMIISLQNISYHIKKINEIRTECEVTVVY